MIVDNHADLSDTAQYILAHENYRVVLAFDVIHAVEKARRERPDLVLMDISPVDHEALEAARKILTDEETKNISVVFLSDVLPKDMTDSQACEIFGQMAIPVFHKTMDKKELLKKLRQILFLGTEDKALA